MAEFPPIRFKYTDSGLASGIQEFESGDTITGDFVDIALSSLSDVSATLAPAVGDVLVWDGTEWTASADGGSGGGGGVSFLSALSDTNNVENANIGAVLVKTAGDWEPSGASLVSGTAPGSPYTGQLWYDTTSTALDLLQTVSGTSISADYGLGISERILYVDASAGAVIVSGVDASAYPNRLLDIHKVDSTTNQVTVSGVGSTINGDTSITLDFQYDTITIHAFQDNWYIL